jgi:hypothetical protein
VLGFGAIKLIFPTFTIKPPRKCFLASELSHGFCWVLAGVLLTQERGSITISDVG